MNLLSEYVLFSEILKNSTKSYSAVSRKYPNKTTIGKLSFVRKADLQGEDRIDSNIFTDLSYLYPMGELGMILGRNRDHLSHLKYPSKGKGKAKPIETIKIGNKYNMIVLTDEFVDNIKKGYTPFMIDTNSERDYKVLYEENRIIDFYEMKIGFY